MNFILPMLVTFCGIALFVGIWVSVVQLLSTFSGWRRLAKEFPDVDGLSGTKLSMQSAKIGYIQYNNCLTFLVNSEGFRLSILFPFRVGHPSIFIPWDDCHNPKEVNVWMVQCVKFDLGDPAITKLVIPRSILERKPT